MCQSILCCWPAPESCPPRSDGGLLSSGLKRKRAKARERSKRMKTMADMKRGSAIGKAVFKSNAFEITTILRFAITLATPKGWLRMLHCTTICVQKSLKDLHSREQKTHSSRENFSWGEPCG